LPYDTDTEVAFSILDVDRSTVNALRTALYADVPVLAPERVTLVHFNGVQEQEMVTLNLGLCPFRRVDWGVPGPSESYTIHLTQAVDAEEPRGRWVTSRAIRCPPEIEPVHFASREQEKAAVYDEGMQITKLCPGEQVDLTAVVRTGTARGAGRTRWMAGTPTVREVEPHRHYEARFSSFGGVTAVDALFAALSSMEARMSHYASMR
jgi:hypothetical protein